ncbi:Fc.00g033740.m01.CDS01 [Cosmosporella sp. VM-42]
MTSTQKVITDTNKSPLVQVLTLMFLVIAVLACFVRSGTKIHMIKALKVDDILTVVATIFAVGQSIAVYIGCESGLGKHLETLNSGDIDTFFKSQYAANAMFVASLFCSKLSGTMSLRIMSRSNQKWIIVACDVVVGLWGLTALFVNFFQCRLPTPWRYGDGHRCIDRTAFWTYYSIANIVTDVAIVIIMTENVRKIQTSRGKKTLVMSVFGSRILVTPAIILQIYYSNKAFASQDSTFSIWEAAIAMELVQCLAIFTVCVPNLKPFLDSVESGQIRIDDLRRQGKSSSNGYPSNRPGYAGYKSPQSSALASGSRAIRSVNGLDTTDSQGSNVHEMVDFSKSKGRGVSKKITEEQGAAWDGQSHKSHSSQTILIHQTWQVEVQSMHEKALRQT